MRFSYRRKGVGFIASYLGAIDRPDTILAGGDQGKSYAANTSGGAGRNRVTVKVLGFSRLDQCIICTFSCEFARVPVKESIEQRTDGLMRGIVDSLRKSSLSEDGRNDT